MAAKPEFFPSTSMFNSPMTSIKFNVKNYIC